MSTSKNPFVGEPATVAAQDAPRAGKATRIPGSALVRDLTQNRIGSAKVYRYWVGVTPNCPQSDVTCAGLSFPKTNDDILSQPGEQRTVRAPRIGAIVFIDEQRIRRLRDELPRMVARFRNGQHEEPGTGENIRDAFTPPNPGEVFKIPSADHVAACKQMGMPTSEYVYTPGDVPGARYMFAQLCADQENGSRGDVYPETLETAGLEWPEPMDLDDLLN